MLYSFGSNSNGQLGLGLNHYEDAFLPVISTFPLQPSSDNSPELKPHQIAGGGNHVALLTNTGALYFSGLNTSGQCDPYIGGNNVIKNMAEFSLLHLNSDSNAQSPKWTSVSCTWESTVAVTTSSINCHSRVYTWGKGVFGELGCGENITITHGHPLLIDELTNKNIIKVSCGLRHVIALTDSGELYGWGNSRYGQLGEHATRGKNFRPVKICVNEDNDVESRKETDENETVNNNATGIKILDVACGQNHTAMLSNNGYIFTFGCNKHGQLGIESPVIIANTPKIQRVLIPGQKQGKRQVVEISCGWNTTFARCDDGTVFAWGRNDHGQLGVGMGREIDLLDDVGKEQVGDNAVALKNVNSLHVDPKQQKSGWLEKPVQLSYLPQQLPLKSSSSGANFKLSTMKSGSEHVLAITEDGMCMAWGWNEHGNCGTGNTEDVYEPKIVQGLDEKSIITFVGTGCGSSYVWAEKTLHEQYKDITFC